MLALTNTSIDRVRAMAEKEQLSNASIRIAVVGGGCSGFSYEIEFDDEERDGDQVVDTGSFRVYVDPMSYQYVQNTIVDYVESFNFTGFHFDNPNAKRTCGCGSSFGV
jgi:iron-sulfur cluster insertion protein